MSYRRPHLDRVNPRYVPPSRHTLFIRGLPGSTNVDAVKNHFSDETGSKCSVEFFSTSDDKIRFSVAIRFKSQDTAREMLEKYNGKELLGHPVEITWFKDLKKARARIYDDQRTGRFRGYRAGFRGTHRGGFPERRGRGYSPARGRDRSYSGGDGPGARLHNSRRSASSRSTSASRSGSRSSPRKRRRVAVSPLQNDMLLGSAKMPRRQPRMSHSLSTPSPDGSSRSSSNQSRPGRNRSSDGRQKPFPRRAPVQEPNSPAHNRSSFANAPPPPNEVENVGSNSNELGGGGSNLLSGLIHLNARRPLNSQSRMDASSYSSSRSKSVSSKSVSSRSPSPKRQRDNHRRPTRTSPVSSGLLRSSYKDSPSPSKVTPAASLSGSNWKPLSFSEEEPPQPASSVSDIPGTTRPNSIFAAYGNSKAPPIVSAKIILSPLIDYNKEKNPIDLDIAESSNHDNGLPKTSSPTPETAKNSKVKGWEVAGDRQEYRPTGKSAILSTSSAPIKDKQALIQERKTTIEEEYKRDCETFATVVRTLISKDGELEGRLLPLLKKILHERGQRCIEELRALIEEAEGIETAEKSHEPTSKTTA